MSALSLRRRWLALLPLLSLVTGTLVWGTIWYPYRVLAAAGLSALVASALTYAIALLAALLAFGRTSWVRPDADLVLLSISAGVTNVGFIWATNHGPILRVLLLFYLMPVWTLAWVWLLLGIAPNRRSLLLTGIALLGAAIMLVKPGMTVPLPSSGAEWAAVIAGIAFALSNVLVHRSTAYGARTKSVWILAGCTLLATFGASFEYEPSAALLPASSIVLLLLLGLVLFAINLVVQHGVERIHPERVPLIYLFELVVAAGSAWLLAGEPVHLRDALGGSLILIASAMPARRIAARPPDAPGPTPRTLPGLP